MEQEKTVIKYSKELTRRAALVFGPVVKKVYVSTWDINSSQIDIKQRLNREEYSVRNTPVKDALNFDSCNIIVEFLSGVKIQISSSEWGSISIADTNNMTQWEE